MALVWTLRSILRVPKGSLSNLCDNQGHPISRLSTTLAQFGTNNRLPAEIEFEQFESLRKKGKVHILDVRERQELSEIGEIPGCTNIPLGEVESAFRLSNEEFEEKYGIIKPAINDAIITLCMKGIRSETARSLLMSSFQYENISNYRGSFLEWREKSE